MRPSMVELAHNELSALELREVDLNEINFEPNLHLPYAPSYPPFVHRGGVDKVTKGRSRT